MPSLERRQVPRTPLDRLAYVHIQPDNGGIVLNVSDQGLCFHSIAPVEKNGGLHLAFQENQRQIELCGELIWTDEVKKVGGIHFSSLTEDARTLISALAKQHPPQFDEPRPGKYAVLTALSQAPASERGNAWARSSLSAVRVRFRVNSFSRGLMTGFLISALAASVFVFCYAYRGPLGKGLIRLGQTLSETPTVNSQAARAASLPGSPAVSQADLARPVQSAQPRTRVSRREDTANEPEVIVRKFPSLIIAGPSTTGPAPSVSANTSTRVPAAPLEPQQIALSAAVPRIATARDTAGPAPERIASVGSVTSSVNPPLLYFDLGRYKDQTGADRMRNTLSRLGLRSDVVKRGRLWGSAYQVLVGPYSSEEDENRIERDLLAHGYRPRPFERGSRDFPLNSELTIHGSHVSAGDFVVSWESYVSDAKVKFVQAGDLVATADAHWKKVSERYARNEYVYERGAGGSRTLLEIHFAGMDRALSFPQ